MTASRNIVWWLNLCALFSVVNRSQSTSLPVRRDFGYLTNQNIQNTNFSQQKVFKSTSLFFHPYSTDDTCSKSKLHSFHSLEKLLQLLLLRHFYTFPHNPSPFGSCSSTAPPTSSFLDSREQQLGHPSAGRIQFTAADELSKSIFHLHTLTLSIPSSTGAHWVFSHRSPFRRKLLLTNLALKFSPTKILQQLLYLAPQTEHLTPR